MNPNPDLPMLDNSSSSTTDLGTTFFLPIVWQRPNKATETRIAVTAFIEAVLEVPEPFSLAFVMRAGRDRKLTAGYLVETATSEQSETLAELLRSISNALVSWQELGEPLKTAWVDASSNSYTLKESDGAGRRIFNHRSAPWTVARELPTDTSLRVDLISNTSTETQTAGVDCRVTIQGEGLSASLIASLLASDVPGRTRLQAELLRGGDAPTQVMDLSMVSHLVSAPSRVEAAWPESPVTTSKELLQHINEATPPHAAFFGGSGLGKTTLLEHLIDEGFRQGRTTVVLCPHGDLAERAASLAKRHQVAVDAIDFSSSAPVPQWNLTKPPEGISERQWANNLVSILRAVWWDAPDEWFGPVWRRAMRVACRLLVEDPERFHSVTELLDVLRPENKDRWLEVAKAIGDPGLLSEVVDVWDSISRDRESHMGTYLVSKLEPFVSNEHIRAICGTTKNSFSLENIRKGRSLIISAPAGVLGDEGSNLILSTALSQLWDLQRQQLGDRAEVDIYLDEAQRVPTQVPIQMLTEARKFGVRLRMAAQNPGILDAKLRDAVLTNCGAVGTFRLGAAEASILEPLYPVSSVGRLARLPKFDVAITFGDSELTGTTGGAIVEAPDGRDLQQIHRIVNAEFR